MTHLCSNMVRHLNSNSCLYQGGVRELWRAKAAERTIRGFWWGRVFDRGEVGGWWKLLSLALIRSQLLSGDSRLPYRLVVYNFIANLSGTGPDPRVQKLGL